MWTDDEDDLESFEDADEADDFSESDTVSCPACGAAIYEDAPQCPQCGEYVILSTSPWQGRHWLWVVLGILGVLATIVALIG